MNVSTGAQSAATQNGGVSGSAFSYKWNVGYSFLQSEELLGPRGWVKLGYKSSAFSLPSSTQEQTGPTTFSSVFVGIGGDVPINPTWGALVDFNFRLLTSVSQNWLNETTSGASEVEFFIGGYYRLSSRMNIRGGFNLMAANADFSRGSSLSQKTMTFAPALLYYF